MAALCTLQSWLDYLLHCLQRPIKTSSSKKPRKVNSYKCLCSIQSVDVVLPHLYICRQDYSSSFLDNIPLSSLGLLLWKWCCALHTSVKVNAVHTSDCPLISLCCKLSHRPARGLACSHTSLKQHPQPGDCVYGCWQTCSPWAMLKPRLTLISSVETLSPLCDPLAGNDTALFPGNVTVCTTVGSGMTWYKVI